MREQPAAYAPGEGAEAGRSGREREHATTLGRIAGTCVRLSTGARGPAQEAGAAAAPELPDPLDEPAPLGVLELLDEPEPPEPPEPSDEDEPDDELLDEPDDRLSVR